MTRGQKHVSQKQYSRAEVASRGLACPFVSSEHEGHITIDACKPHEGFNELRLLTEHIWRKHTRFYRCCFCPKRWSIATSRKEVKEKKEKHWEGCDGKQRGVLYSEGPFDGDAGLLNWKQEELFARTSSIKNVGAKLEALYKACGKPVPETYYATVALPAVQPQIADGPVAPTTARSAQQSTGHEGGLLEGFGPVSPEAPNLETSNEARVRTTVTNVSKVNAIVQARGGPQVSGANRARDADSGYESMPKGNGDTSFADRLSAQPVPLWPYAPHDTRSYEMSAGPADTASPGRVIHADDDFPPDVRQVNRVCFPSYDAADSFLDEGVSSSARIDHSLRGLDSAGESLTMFDYINDYPDFPEI